MVWCSCFGGRTTRSDEEQCQGPGALPLSGASCSTSAAILSFGSKRNSKGAMDISVTEARRGGKRAADVVSTASRYYINLFSSNKEECSATNPAFEADVQRGQDSIRSAHTLSDYAPNSYSVTGQGRASREASRLRMLGRSDYGPPSQQLISPGPGMRTRSCTRRVSQAGPGLAESLSPLPVASREPSHLQLHRRQQQQQQQAGAASAAPASAKVGSPVSGPLPAKHPRHPGTSRSRSDRVSHTAAICLQSPAPCKPYARAQSALHGKHAGRSDCQSDGKSDVGSPLPPSPNTAEPPAAASTAAPAAAAAAMPTRAAAPPALRPPRFSVDCISSAAAGAGPAAPHNLAAAAQHGPTPSHPSLLRPPAGVVARSASVYQRSSIVYARDGSVTVTGLPPSCLTAGRAPRRCVEAADREGAAEPAAEDAGGLPAAAATGPAAPPGFRRGGSSSGAAAAAFGAGAAPTLSPCGSAGLGADAAAASPFCNDAGQRQQQQDPQQQHHHQHQGLERPHSCALREPSDAPQQQQLMSQSLAVEGGGPRCDCGTGSSVCRSRVSHSGRLTRSTAASTTNFTSSAFSYHLNSEAAAAAGRADGSAPRGGSVFASGSYAQQRHGPAAALAGAPQHSSSLLATEARDVTGALSRLQEACMVAQGDARSQRLQRRASVDAQQLYYSAANALPQPGAALRLGSYGRALAGAHGRAAPRVPPSAAAGAAGAVDASAWTEAGDDWGEAMAQALANASLHGPLEEEEEEEGHVPEGVHVGVPEDGVFIGGMLAGSTDGRPAAEDVLRPSRAAAAAAAAQLQRGGASVQGGPSAAAAEGEDEYNTRTLKALLHGDFLNDTHSAAVSEDDEDGGVLEYRYGGFALGGPADSFRRRGRSEVEASGRCVLTGVVEASAECAGEDAGAEGGAVVSGF